ncbi:MAG: hypothetical protein VX822_02085 [Candidatus Neomarinimicrobiota bacterium]|nr:hypothetical protein [Candidatus Neomarinimicrobiota bacterium]
MKLNLKLVLMSLLWLPLTLPGQKQNTTIAMEALEPEEDYSRTISEIRFFGDYYIAVDEKSKENVRVYGGDLFVAGTVDGQIVVVGGNVTLESTAVVMGRIIAIGGAMHLNEGATVRGEIVQANIREGINIARSEDTFSESDIRRFEFEDDFFDDRDWEAQSLIHPGVDAFIYNRDEGLLFTPFNWRWDRNGRSTFRTSLSLGYRFGQREAAGRISLEKSFGGDVGPIVFLSAFQQSRSDDTFRLPEDENTLSSVFARQDFLDRWSEEGYEAGVMFHESIIHAKVMYHSVEIAPFDKVKNLVTWFHKERDFRAPVSVPNGNVTSVAGKIEVGTLHGVLQSSGVMLTLEGESIFSADNLKNFNRFITVFHLNWEPTPDILFRSRTMLGESQGALPHFRVFGVGGLGSVSAHPYKVQIGNRMVQLNAELLLSEFMRGDHYLSLFVDSGNAWDREAYTLTDFTLISKNAVSAVGIGIGDDDLDWRINVARPLDGRDSWETTFRFNLNF